jgi:aminocarboxymuconate-semialdehyde decarboxylase
VFVHPASSPDPVAHSLGLPDSLIDSRHDAWSPSFITATRRARRTSIYLSHAGVTIPFLTTRLGIVDHMKFAPGEEVRGTFADTIRRLYWDTALSWRAPILRMLRSEGAVISP